MARSPYELIKSPDYAVWRGALAALAKDKSPQAIEAVASLLSDSVWQKREAAANCLIASGEELIGPLFATASETNLDEFYWLLRIAGSFGSKNSLAFIKNALRSKSAEIRSYAVRAVAIQKNLLNARCLYSLLNDHNWSVRKLVFEMLLNFGDIILPDLRSLLSAGSESLSHIVATLFVKIGKDRVVNELKQLYTQTSFAMRFSIIAALGELGTPKAIDFLVSTLSDSSWAIRRLAAEKIASLGSKTFDALTAAFAQSGSVVKHDIMGILVSLLGEKSISLLDRLLTAPGQEFKLLAVKNLAVLKSDEATQKLMQCLASSDRIVSDYASDCLLQKNGLNISILLDKLNTADENLRFQIIKIIGSIGGLALEPIIKILETGSKQERLFLLGVLQRITPDGRIIEILIRLLGDKSWPVRHAAAQCLKEYKEAAVTSIVKGLNNESDDIKYWSNKVLIDIGAEAITELNSILETNSRPDLMPYIVSALLSMNHPDAVPAVIRFLENNDDYRIKTVFENVPEVKGKDVINTILNLLQHPDERVCHWLAELLKKITDENARRMVLLGLTHSKESVRCSVAEAVNGWQSIDESDIKLILKHLRVEKSLKARRLLAAGVAKNPFESAVEEMREFLSSCDSHLKRELMLVVAEQKTKPFMQMVGELFAESPELISDEDLTKTEKILACVYADNPEKLIKGLSSTNKAYRLLCISALDSFNDRLTAFKIIENILPNEEPEILRRAAKTLARFFFSDDFRLKGAVTDFLLSLGTIITEPLSEYIETLENDMDRRSLIDLIESVGGTVDPAILLHKGEQKIVLSDTHLDEVLEKRRQALEEVEKYDHLIQTTHTLDLTIMFTDIKGFTAFSAKSSLSEVMSMMKQHDEILKPVFEKYNGEVLKKIGDAFLISYENHNNAILAAIEIQRRLKEYNAQSPKERQLAVRIAINSGPVVKTEKDVMGDTVNLASRLESVVDAFEIGITEFTFERINREIFSLEANGEHSFKGISRPIKVYLVGWQS